MEVKELPHYSVLELNQAVANLLQRGFAPKFILNATVSKAQLKKGHLWLTLTDTQSSINAVVWSSIINNLSFIPKESDGVVIVGKLNYWEVRGTLIVQILDIKPSISTVLRKFEVVRDLLLKEGLIDQTRCKPLPDYPKTIAILTSVPSSALADMLKIAKEMWPLTRLVVLPISVQGEVANDIQHALKKVALSIESLSLSAIILARGGGSREDLTVFDDENLCREIAKCPIPVITGLGHEDDLTVADLVADYRASTPTAAIITVLPNRILELTKCINKKKQLKEKTSYLLRSKLIHLNERKATLLNNSPINIISRYKESLLDKDKLLKAFSPDRWLKSGFAIIKDDLGNIVHSLEQIVLGDNIKVLLKNGIINATVRKIRNERSLK